MKTIKKKTRRFDFVMTVEGNGKVAHTLPVEIVPNGARRAQSKDSKTVRMTRSQTAAMLRDWRAKGRPYKKGSSCFLGAAIKTIIIEGITREVLEGGAA